MPEMIGTGIKARKPSVSMPRTVLY
jgi:hypothetical protein